MNQHIIIGWLGGNSEMFIHHDFKAGRQVAEELNKSPSWKAVYSGSLVDLITLLGDVRAAPVTRAALLGEMDRIIQTEEGIHITHPLKEAIFSIVRDAWKAAEEADAG